jgi:hypothetical protein
MHSRSRSQYVGDGSNHLETDALSNGARPSPAAATPESLATLNWNGIQRMNYCRFSLSPSDGERDQGRGERSRSIFQAATYRS